MKYSGGEEAQVGDKVELWPGCNGVVVCNIDADEYAPDFPLDEWTSIKFGIIVQSEQRKLFHYFQADGDLRFIGRGEVEAFAF